MGTSLTAKLYLALALGAIAGTALGLLGVAILAGSEGSYGWMAVTLGALGTTVVTGALLGLVILRPAARLRRAASSALEAAVRQSPLEGEDDLEAASRAFVTLSRQLGELRAQLVQSEKLAAFGQLGAGITHEVKNPITALVGFAQLAQKRLDDPAKVTELLKIIEAEGLRCRDLLGSFLSFARQSTSAWERLVVNALVEDAARILRHQLNIHGVTLELELGPDVPGIMGNATELKQVIVNLAFNAQQAMPTGGTVWLATGLADDGMVVIEVRDDGSGIPAEIRDKIFDPFFTTKRPGEGTGLGLAVSQSIVRGHKGALSVDAAYAKGARFFIRLPAAAVDDEARAIASS